MKDKVLRLKSEYEKAYKFWERRYLASAWNDDGKGKHIPADTQMDRYRYKIEALNDLLKEL